MNFYSFHIGDYAAHTRCLSLMEDLAYRRLLDVYYLNEHPLNGCSTDVAREIGMRDYVDEVEYVLNKFFEFDADLNCWGNKRADEEIARFKDKQGKASSAGRASAERRSNGRSTPVQENSTDVQQTSSECATNQEPITNNQEPVTKEKKEAQAKPARFDPREMALPECIKPSVWEAWIDYRRGRKLTCTEATMKAQAKNLEDWWHEGHDPNAIITASISNGWQGLFPPKGGVAAKPVDGGLEANRRLAEMAVKRLNLVGA